MKKPGGNISAGKFWDSFSDRTVLGGDRTEQSVNFVAVVAKVLTSLLPDACDNIQNSSREIVVGLIDYFQQWILNDMHK